MTTKFEQSFTDFEDLAYQKELIRPAEIKEDVKLMEQRKRVTNIMKSKFFRKSLENIFEPNVVDDSVGESTSTLYLADISEQLLLSALPRKKIESLYQFAQRKGIICINDLCNDDNSPYDQRQRLSRCKLASVCRLMDMYGWNNEFNTILTMRPFHDRELFLVNPFGLMLHEITASSLALMDFKGHIMDFGSTILEVHSRNWLIHSAIYSLKPKVKAILHLKTPASVSISSSNKIILPLSTEAFSLGDISILDKLNEIDLIINDSDNILIEYKKYLSDFCGSTTKLFILPNNGILICGDTMEEAWHLLTNCQEACEIQLKIINFDLDDLYIPRASIQNNALNYWTMDGDFKSNDARNYLSQYQIYQIEFEALMRHLDNNGYRTGYLYQQQNIYRDIQYNKSENINNNLYDIQIPPSYTSVGNKTQQFQNYIALSEDNEKFDRPSLKIRNEKWFNTPNTYKLIDGKNESLTDLTDNKSSKWISTKVADSMHTNPQRPVTAGAYTAFQNDSYKSSIYKEGNQYNINPKELKEQQKKVKNKYYYDTNTAGPMSCLLDSGLNFEEARRLKTEALQKQISSGRYPDDIVTSASKGVIQRGQKALVYQDLYKPCNPFEKVTIDDLNNYHDEIDRKLNPDRYKDTTNISYSSPIEENEIISIPPSRSATSVSRHSFQENPNLECCTDNISDGDMIAAKDAVKITSTFGTPVCGTITSETSGPDFSHDELDKQEKTKKKRRFKLPLFSKKKKDKSAKN